MWLSHVSAGTQASEPSAASPTINRDVDWKWQQPGSQSLPYGMLALQEAAYYTLPQYWPCCFMYFRGREGGRRQKSFSPNTQMAGSRSSV